MILRQSQLSLKRGEREGRENDDKRVYNDYDGIFTHIESPHVLLLVGQCCPLRACRANYYHYYYRLNLKKMAKKEEKKKPIVVNEEGSWQVQVLLREGEKKKVVGR